MSTTLFGEDSALPVGGEALRMARRDDPETSKLAAEKHVASGVASAQRNQVLHAVQHFAGKTSAELAQATGLDRHMVARRLPEIERMGGIRRGESRKCEATGNPAMTWWPVEVEL